VEYQGTGKASGINSGLGASVVTAENVNGYVKITVKSNSNPVTHYYVAKPKDAAIYMATNNRGEVSPGELRFLARLRTSEVPTGVHGNVGDVRGCTAIEGKDTFKCANGHTACKMYTSDRFIEDKVHCVSGSVCCATSRYSTTNSS
jgi:rhamnogalacturonan endolyase